MVIRDVCPRYKSPKYKKNGHIHNGKQNDHCHDCGRQFVGCCEQYRIAGDKRTLIERLLLERISLRGICRVVGVQLIAVLNLTYGLKLGARRNRLLAGYSHRTFERKPL